MDAGAGDDAGGGSAGAPWRTLQRAADAVVAGDHVVVRAGTYAGFSLTRSGNAGARITFSAQPGVVIDRASARADAAGVPAGINLGMATDVPSYVTVEGFTLRPLAGEGEWYAGIRAAGKSSPRLVGLVLRGNVCDLRTAGEATPDKYGIYVAWSDGTVVEGNVTSGCYNSGIYVANSSRNYVVRANDVSDCGGNGIHNNGDAAAGAPGVNTNGLLEGNVIHNVGYGIGGQAISCDGLQDSVIRNNLIYDAHAKGISLYVTNASDGSKRNVVANNTVITAADSTGACLRIPGGSTGNTIFNNVFLSARASVSGDGGYAYSDEAGGNFYDYNVVTDPVQRQISLAGWRSQGRDVHGRSAGIGAAALAAIFVDPAGGDYRPKLGSLAVDAGASAVNGKAAPSTDLAGAARPQGLGHDAGAYEFGAPVPPKLSFAAPTYSIDESAGTITISVVRTGDTSGAVSVGFATADGTAEAGSDYTAISGTLNFDAGETSATFTVTLLEDDSFEDDETILLTLSSPTGGAALGTPSSATLTISGDAPGAGGLGNGIAYDSDGNLHFVYNDRVTGAIMYAVRDSGGQWSAPQTVDASANSYPSMALDSVGRPGVAYYNAATGDLRYAHFNGSGWQIQTVDDRRTAGLYPSLAYGASGRPVIAYYHKTYQDLRLAAFNGTTWSIATVDSTGDVGRYASLAQNPTTGRWAIGYVDATTGRAKFAEQTRTSWATAVVDTATLGGTAYVSLAFDASNRPAMSYYDIRNADLKVARYNGSSWSARTVAAKGFVGMYSNIRIGAGADDLEVLYYNRGTDSVFRAESDGTTWSLGEVFSDGGRWLSAARSPDGTLTLSCLEADGLRVVDL